MDKEEEKLLKKILPNKYESADAYNIRLNGSGILRKVNEYINIESREDGQGINVYVKDNTSNGVVDIPVLVSKSGMTDIVYNDFFIGKNSNVSIIAGCGISNHGHKDSAHNGIHRFFIEENSNVKYYEVHYGEGSGEAKRILNPTTEVILGNNSTMVMETAQIKGVDDANRITKAVLNENSKLTINEKIYTSNNQNAKTMFEVLLKGNKSSAHVVSRSVAEDESNQTFESNMIGEADCYGHVECDAIIKDNARVKSIPEIDAACVDATLVHEATIGKIAGDQFIKLMSLGLSAREAEKAIIDGFLK